jgi:hypothetical protein
MDGHDRDVLQSARGEELLCDLLARQTATGLGLAVFSGNPLESLRGSLNHHTADESAEWDQERENAGVKILDEILKIHRLTPKLLGTCHVQA